MKDLSEVYVAVVGGEFCNCAWTLYHQWRSHYVYLRTKPNVCVCMHAYVGSKGKQLFGLFFVIFNCQRICNMYNMHFSPLSLSLFPEKTKHSNFLPWDQGGICSFFFLNRSFHITLNLTFHPFQFFIASHISTISFMKILKVKALKHFRSACIRVRHCILLYTPHPNNVNTWGQAQTNLCLTSSIWPPASLCFTSHIDNVWPQG